jgi:4-coumarate--CoA ligase
VGDVCVVPVPDEYSGEIPLAFVVPHASIASKINEDAKEAEKVKAELISVCMTS